MFTVLPTLVASLGVFNTVLPNTHERRRDLGMLKSIGMTPRQVVVMTVTSVTGLGVVGGLLGIPLGITAHRLIVDNVGVVDFPAYMKDVWHAPQPAAMLLAGAAIAVLGALVPARSTARMTIASLLHTERVCNAAALPSGEPSTDTETDAGVSAADVRERAAAAFDVPGDSLTIKPPASPAGALKARSQAAADSAEASWTATSTSPTRGLQHTDRRLDGFTAHYSARTGALLKACWGDLCDAS
ncbi:FtsX-like permease family protein [Streptomyces sp. NPDC101219]|uniref:FtsX-like permease family protein n=1 Tax=Streptomyces sp. NPDC101219 TaxID=3366131 RepID=UPI0038067ECB